MENHVLNSSKMVDKSHVFSSFGTVSHTKTLVYLITRLLMTFKNTFSNVCQIAPILLNNFAQSAFLRKFQCFSPILNSHSSISLFGRKIEKEKSKEEKIKYVYIAL